jgi:hypothetical protein
MDESLQDLEAELTRLRPAPVSPELVARIERELEAAAAVSRARRRTWWAWSMALPAAAALAVLLASAMRRDFSAPGAAVAAEKASDLLKPVAAENVLYAARDEGLVTLADGTTARRERLNYIDTITWTNPRTHASLRWSVPREEVRVVPVSFQ